MKLQNLSGTTVVSIIQRRSRSPAISGRDSINVPGVDVRLVVIDESVTANTVFHGRKLPILNAFHLVFRLTAKKKGMSTIELGAEVGVEQKTAWLFKRKIQAVMKDTNKLNDHVDVEETMIGSYSSGHENRGRSRKEKTIVVVATEVLEDGRTGISIFP